MKGYKCDIRNKMLGKLSCRMWSNLSFYQRKTRLLQIKVVIYESHTKCKEKKPMVNTQKIMRNEHKLYH